MFQALQVLAIILVAIAMALALAHTLELPGKMRLSRDAYLGVQPIYYPGFTIGGGVGEGGGLISTLLLVFLTPTVSVAFWLTLGAFLALLAMHAAYWALTHPVNNFWVQGLKPSGFAERFFSFNPLNRIGDAQTVDWTGLRDRWEYSHVLRAGLSLLSLSLLAAAVADCPAATRL
jgi:hypothetical protein